MASSFLHKKETIRALHPTSGVSSVIRNIRKVVEDETVLTSQGRNRRSKKEPRDEYLYEIFFKARCNNFFRFWVE